MYRIWTEEQVRANNVTSVLSCISHSLVLDHCRWWSRRTCGFLSAVNNSILFSYNDVKCTKYLISTTTYKEAIVPRHICKSITV